LAALLRKLLAKPTFDFGEARCKTFPNKETQDISKFPIAWAIPATNYLAQIITHRSNRVETEKRGNRLERKQQVKCQH